MVQGVMCGGTFITKKALTFAGCLSGLSLLAALIILGTGLGLTCSYEYDDYYDSCVSVSSLLIINGGVLTGLCVVFMVVIAAVVCNMKESAPIMIQQPHVPYGTTPNMPLGQAVTNPLSSVNYPQANTAYPQQYPTSAMPQMPKPPGQEVPHPITAPAPQSPLSAAP